MATVKHWVNNNQEDNRFDVSANLPDDRTQVRTPCAANLMWRYLTRPFTA
jgi:hypothetical protein